MRSRKGQVGEGLEKDLLAEMTAGSESESTEGGEGPNDSALASPTVTVPNVSHWGRFRQQIKSGLSLRSGKNIEREPEQDPRVAELKNILLDPDNQR